MLNLFQQLTEHGSWYPRCPEFLAIFKQKQLHGKGLLCERSQLDRLGFQPAILFLSIFDSLEIRKQKIYFTSKNQRRDRMDRTLLQVWHNGCIWLICQNQVVDETQSKIATA